MPILEIKSQVKVTVTGKWNRTLIPPCDLAQGLIVCLIGISKVFLKQRTKDYDTLNTFCSRSSLHLGCVLDKFSSVIRYTGTYCA